MKYPEGEQVKLGDVIWWNEGSNRGKVALILENPEDFLEFGIAPPGAETKEQLSSYGPSETGIYICASLESEEMTTDVFCPEEDFTDEGIGLCSSKN